MADPESRPCARRVGVRRGGDHGSRFDSAAARGAANHESVAALVPWGFVCSAVAMIGLNRLKSIPTWAIVVHFSFVSLLFSGASFFLFERRLPTDTGVDWSANTLLMLICVGLFATVGQFF